ncbi:hypothetical protein [Streptomyces sp. NPDC058632]|uniref:hypothetical protein n=1 Tax=unclassified Streptomyces TaxID=2593676 RepID=UPI00365C14F5
MTTQTAVTTRDPKGLAAPRTGGAAQATTAASADAAPPALCAGTAEAETSAAPYRARTRNRTGAAPHGRPRVR